MTIQLELDQTAKHLKLLIDQLFDIESTSNARKGIPESWGTSIWNEFTNVRKHIWLDGENVVIIGKSTTFYKIVLDQLGQQIEIFHLSQLDEDNFQLHILRQGDWIVRFQNYVATLQARANAAHNFEASATDAFKPIDF